MSLSTTRHAKPFLKWAGGKGQLLAAIAQHFPFAKDDSFTLVEPFVGGGAVLFWVLNNFPKLERAVINDVNPDLVNLYRIIQADVGALIALLQQYQQQYHELENKPEAKKEFYYAKREQFNARDSGELMQAALFIFLNRTCFNGLYRVNRHNAFNVPIGNYKQPLICDADNLRAVAQQLQKVTILHSDFADTLRYADATTCFYLDPPYRPLSQTASFNSYAKDGFDDAEQVRLKQFCDQLSAAGAKWLLSNSDMKNIDPSDEFFDQLYAGYRIERVPAKRRINSKAAERGEVMELLIVGGAICEK